MLKYAGIFLALAIVAAVAGFSLAVSLAATIAKALFYAFIIACLYFLVRHFTKSRL
jgi:uncharacterized membrane protein YtjA (UPF0391 family)